MRILFLLVLILNICLATTYIATTPTEVQNYTNLLQAGDTLLVQNGVYNMNWNIQNRNGNSNDWIVIKAMGDSAVINGVNYDNVIDIYNCRYVELKGFEITNSYSGSGIDGIKFRTTSDHIYMEGLRIHDITGVGISANPAGESFTYLTIRYCHLYDIIDVGEGLYIGNHDGLSPVHHCLVEFNWIHDCHPHKGIQFKRGTYLNIIQDNVVYNCDEAGIVLYKTDQASGSENNIVRRNVIWNAPEGIFAVGQTNIDNNIIFDCSYGINVRNYSSWGMNDLYLRNNTIYSCGTTCLRLDDWNIAAGEMVCINNACYQDLVSQSAIQAPDGIGPGYVSHNRHYGQSQVVGSALGNAPAQEFINPSIMPGSIDLYPLNSSSLIDTGTSNYNAPSDDFNWRSRPYNGLHDIGAYEWSQAVNPGWPIQEGFKQIYTGIRETDRSIISGLSKYPTIMGNIFDLSTPWPKAQFEIRDACGRPINVFRRDPGLSSGVYFLIIKDNSNQWIGQRKIVIIR